MQPVVKFESPATSPRYRNRGHAGEVLAHALETYSALPGVLVLGLPRGGVPVAAIVARKLGAELDILVVRKLGVPGHEELAMGALATGGVRVMNPHVVDSLGITESTVQRVAAEELVELNRRERTLRGERPPARVEGRTVILVDDGVATGATMRSAIASLRAQRVREIVVAVPVAPENTLAELRREADHVICPLCPELFSAISEFYLDFSQVTTEAAKRLLENAGAGLPSAGGWDVLIPSGAVEIAGRLSVPSGGRGIIAFAHGSGSSRFSPRNRFVARALEDAGFGTLLVDLLTTEEEAADQVSGQLRFDIELLAKRAVDTIDWLGHDHRTAALPVGLFGASTGAAAALYAAVSRPSRVRAIVSRGGRPDLVAQILPQVEAPTLLIVGGEDHIVLELNQGAAARLQAPHRLEVVPGATHLFEEPGKLEAVAQLAAQFFGEYLALRQARKPR